MKEIKWKKKNTREGNFIEVRRTNDKIIPMGRPFVWPDEKIWGGKSLFALTDRFTLIHLTPEAERATLSAWSFAYNQKTQPFFLARCERISKPKLLGLNAALRSTGESRPNHIRSRHDREKHGRFPYRKHVERSLSKRLVAILKTECFN